MKLCRLRGSDSDWHARFFQFVGTVFRSAEAENWQAWCDGGGWSDDYEVFAMIDGDQILSTIGRYRMQLVIDGRTRPGYQLGAVATLESHRRQGLSRRLMDTVIAANEAPDQPILLFANGTVLDFYPRFGFRHIPQRRSIARVAIEPLAAQATCCDPASAADRSRLARLCARAPAIRGKLAARDYYTAVLWHLICRRLTAFWLPGFHARPDVDAVIVATVEGGRLILHDVIADRPFDLRPVLPALIAHPITEVEFRFDPEDWWQAAQHGELDDTSSRLFVRGGADAIAGPVQFPGCAHT